MRGTYWHAPGKGATLGQLRRKANRPESFDPATDDLVTSLALTEYDWDEQDSSRLDEVERRVKEHGSDQG
jgi:hypothetical protein